MMSTTPFKMGSLLLNVNVAYKLLILSVGTTKFYAVDPT